MKRYYMELTPKGFNMHVVDDSNRHKIWAEHPSAKEISKDLYLEMTQAAIMHNKKIKDNESKKDNEQRIGENGRATKGKVRPGEWKNLAMAAWVRLQQKVRLSFNGYYNRWRKLTGR